MPLGIYLVTKSLTLLKSSLGVEPAKLSDIAIDREVWRVLLELQPPRLSSEEKRARRWTKGFTKMNEDERRWTKGFTCRYLLYLG